MIEIRCITSREEQLRIAQACHADPTSGHLGFRRTMARITERFFWKGIDSKDVVKIFFGSLYTVLLELCSLASKCAKHFNHAHFTEILLGIITPSFVKVSVCLYRHSVKYLVIH